MRTEYIGIISMIELKWTEKTNLESTIFYLIKYEEI